MVWILDMNNTRQAGDGLEVKRAACDLGCRIRCCELSSKHWLIKSAGPKVPAYDKKKVVWELSTSSY